jgi:hypothetical protein
MPPRRHAIYFAPRGALAAFGAAWLGWDPVTGAVSDGFALPGLPLPRAELVAAPRRYGLHATLKAPFRLAAGRDPARLDAAASAVARAHARFDLRLEVGAIGPFVALLPAAPPPALRMLADACVTGLDRFRAPPDAAELARRGARLDAAEAAHLARWGYPYVLDRFRFHITLTGPLAPGDLAAAGDALAAALAPLLAAPVPVREICRFTEDGAGRFRLAARHPLARR